MLSLSTCSSPGGATPAQTAWRSEDAVAVAAAAAAAAVAVVFAVVVAVAVAVAVASGAIASDAAVASAVKTGAAREKARNDVTLVDVAAVLSVHKAICAIAGSASAAHDANREGSKSSLIIGGSASAGGSLCRGNAGRERGEWGTVRVAARAEAAWRRRAPWVLGVDSAHLRARRLLSCVSLLTFGIALLVMRARSAASRLETCAAGYERPRGLAECTRARAAQQHAGLAIGVRSTVGGRKVGTRVVKWRLHHFGRRAHRLLDQGGTARSRSSRFVPRAGTPAERTERHERSMDAIRPSGRADSCMRACGGREYERGEA